MIVIVDWDSQSNDNNDKNNKVVRVYYIIMSMLGTNNNYCQCYIITIRTIVMMILMIYIVNTDY